MPVYVFGKAFKGKELIRIGLASKIFGIGEKTSNEICNKLGFYPQMRMHQLNETQILNLNSQLNNLVIEDNLRDIINNNIKQLFDIGHYRGWRHSLNLPVNGQSTKNNAKTAKRLNKLQRYR